METFICEVYWKGELVGTMPVEAGSEAEALAEFQKELSFDVTTND